MTKKQLIILSWSYAFGWVYTCLSRVRTRAGLFLMSPLIPRGKKAAACVEVDGNLKWFEHRIQRKIPQDARQTNLQNLDCSMIDYEQSGEDCISSSSESESEDEDQDEIIDN